MPKDMVGVKAVIFDLYDTLVYIADKTDLYRRLFSELGFKKSSEKRKARRTVLTEGFSSLSELVEKIKPNSGINLKAYEDEIEKENNSVAIFPETKTVLGKLQEREFKVGLISNLSSSHKKPFFDLGLGEYFDKVFFSCEVGLKKPDIKIYQKMLQELGLEPYQALMVGDKLDLDVYPPMSIGMKALHIDRTNEGYDEPDILSLEEIFQYC